MTPDTRPLLTIEDVMKRLRVSRSMAYKLTESGALRCIQHRSLRPRPPRRPGPLHQRERAMSDETVSVKTVYTIPPDVHLRAHAALP
jgi:hypothetical protein